MSDDDGCEFCGFEWCKGECLLCTRCHQEGCVCPPETGGATLDRKASERQAERTQAYNKLVINRLLPKAPKETTLEAFEQRMAKRPKVVLAYRKDGRPYRKKVDD